MKTLSDTAATSQPKWGAGILAAMSIGFLVVVSLPFYSLPSPQPDQASGLLALGCAFFIIACIAILFSLPIQLGQAFSPDNPDFIVANAAGISLAQNLGAPAQFRAWESISEIILAKKFYIIYPDGKLSCRHVVIVFLHPEPRAAENSLVPLQSGVSRSGAGRLYLSADFPNGNWRKFESALRKFAPERMPVKLCSSAVFDRKTGTDNYAEI